MPNIKEMREIVLVAHDVRSCHNVGSLLRTADGLGVKCVYLTGYTPYPLEDVDIRLPHIARKLDSQIHKTALGAEHMVAWRHENDVAACIHALKTDGYRMVALEQSPRAQLLPSYQPAARVALLVGREVEGIEPGILAQCDDIVEIPMVGQKESFNVSIAAAIALYHLALG